jgi:O-antigen/teichoic acid export membrane protein
LLILNLLIKPFWILGIDRSVQNAVGAESYGFYFSLFNFTMLFNILLDFGITNFNNLNIAQNSHLLNKHFSSLIILKFLLAIVYTMITFSVAFIIGYSTKQLSMIGLLCFNQFLISLILYLRSNISGLHFFKTDSIISVLDRTIMIIICAFLLWGHLFNTAFRIEWFIWAQTFSYLITTLVALLIVMNKAQFKKLKWNRLFFLMILKKGAPFALLILLMAFYNRIETVLLERLLPANEGEIQSGYYASAFRLLDAANMIAYLFAVILLPMFSRMIKKKEDIRQLTRLAFSLLLVASTTLALLCYTYSSELMNWMYPIHAGETLQQAAIRIEISSRVLQIIMFGFIGISCTYVFGTLLTANHSLKYLNWMALGGMILNFSLNAILIPSFFAVGSAWASMTTQIISALAQIIIACKVFSIKPDFAFLSRIAVFLIAIVLLSRLSHHINLEWQIQALIFSVFAVLAAVATKLIPVLSFIKIINKSDKMQ